MKLRFKETHTWIPDPPSLRTESGGRVEISRVLQFQFGTFGSWTDVPVVIERVGFPEEHNPDTRPWEYDGHGTKVWKGTRKPYA